MGAVLDNRADELGYFRRIILIVAGHDDKNVEPFLYSILEAHANRGSDA